MRAKVLRGEDGGAILMVLAFLLSLGLLSALWLTVSSAELLIGAARRAEHRRHCASEGAMEEVLFNLETHGAGIIPVGFLRKPAPLYETEEHAGTFGGMNYRWRAAFIPDIHDRDHDPATETVLFNRAFGYEGSPLAKGGYPVVRVDLTADDGGGASSAQAEVTPFVLRPAVSAAWTGGGELLFQGAVSLSGFHHDGDGVPAAEGAVPAVISGSAVHLAAGAHAEGQPPLQEDVPHALPAELPVLLNGGDTARRLSDFPKPPPDGSCLDGIYATDRDFTGPLCGSGILVVHNPGFDPVRYEASRIFMEEGLVSPELDPSYSHLDPGLQPARMDFHRGGTFRGLVVADTVGFVYERTMIMGAMVTLSRSPAAVTAHQLLEVLFSREAIADAGLGGLSHRLGLRLMGPGTTLLSEE
jgi:hypothetical protein